MKTKQARNSQPICLLHQKTVDKNIKSNFYKRTCTWIQVTLLLVHNNIIHNSQKVETTKYPSTDEWVNKIWHMYIMEYYLATKEWSTDKCYHMNEPSNSLYMKEAVTENHILYNFITQNIQNRQIHGDKKHITNCLGLGHGESCRGQGRGVAAYEYRASFQGDENVLGE